MRLARGAAERLKRFTDEGTLLFVVTNQSGLARGVLTRAEVDAVNAEVVRRLSARGVPVAGVLVCPHYPGGVVPELSIRCRCRKPGTLLHARALAAHGLSARRSAVVGDKWDDVGAGVALGAAQAHVLDGPRARAPRDGPRARAGCDTGLLARRRARPASPEETAVDPA